MLEAARRKAADARVDVELVQGDMRQFALGRQFGKLVIGLEGAARIDGVQHLASAHAALTAIAEFVLGQR